MKLSESIVWHRGEGGVPGMHYIDFGLCRARSGTLLAFTCARLQWGDETPHHLWLKRSTDKGLTWDQNIEIESGASGASFTNPVPVVDARSDRVFLFYAINHEGESTRVFLRFSDDDGLTWSARREFADLFAADRERRTFHLPGPGHGIQLASGRIVVPFWHRHPIIKGQISDPLERHYSVTAVHSDDGGESWSVGAYTPNSFHANESRIVQLADGSLLLNARAVNFPAYRVIGISRDEGASWDSIAKDEALQPFPNCDCGLIHLAPDSAPGSDPLLFSHVNHPGQTNGDRRNLTVSFSPDGGKSWTGHLPISPFGGYSDLVQIEPDLCGVLFRAPVAEMTDLASAALDPSQEVNFACFHLSWITP